MIDYGEDEIHVVRAAEHIRRRLHRISSVDVLMRHANGAEVAKVRATSARGTSAMGRLAALVECNPSTLTREATFAGQVRHDELQRWLASAWDRRVQLHYAHFLAVNALRSKRERDAWIQRVIDEKLSVAALGDLIRSVDGDNRGSRTPASETRSTP